MSARLPRVVQHAALMIGGLAVAVLLLEVGVRAFAAPAPFYHELRSRPPLLPDPLVGWRRPPGTTFSVTRGGVAREIRINAEGFRDADRSRDKPAGTLRIAVLGDSFTEALEVPLEQTFPQLLERRLGSTGARVEVLGFGMRGYGTAQEYLVLGHYALAYRPDLVVLAFFVGNDVYDNGLEYSARFRPRAGPFFRLDPATRQLRRVDVTAEEAARAGAKGQSRLRRALTPIARFFWTHLQIYGVVVSRLQGVPGLGRALEAAGLGVPVSPHEGDVYTSAYGAELEEAWRVTEALLRATEALARDHGAPLLVVLVPHPVQFPAYLKEYRATVSSRLVVEDPDKPNRLLRELLGRHGIGHLDLLPVFQAYLARPSARDLYLREDGHFSEEGHRLAEDAIRCELMRRGLVPASLDLSRAPC